MSSIEKYLMISPRQIQNEKHIPNAKKDVTKVVDYLREVNTKKSSFEFKRFDEILSKQIKTKLSWFDRQSTETYNRCKKDFLIEQDEKGNTALHYAALLDSTVLLNEFLLQDNNQQLA